VLDIYVGTSVGSVDRKTLSATTVKVCGDNPDTGEPGLDAEVDVTRSNRMAHNSASVKIYNAKKELRTQMELPGQVIRIDAGYKDQGFGTVFYGQVDGGSSDLSDGTWCTTLTASHLRAKNMAFETLYLSLSYGPGSNLQQVLSDIGAILGVDVVGKSNADIILPNGWVYPGTMKGALAYVQKVLRFNGKDLFYDLAELVVYNVGVAVSSFDGVWLDFNSGLLTAKPVLNAVKDYRQEARTANAIERARARYDKTKSANGKTRISQSIDSNKAKESELHRVHAKFTSIVNHRLRPNCSVWLKSSPVTGEFCLDDIRFKMTTFNDDFYCEGEVSRES
jgi:hypothetical protein